jgi:transcriptional regulator with XRE-family HTH domain
MRVDELEAKLATNVRAQRLAKQLTQVELAELANVSLGAVKNLERGSGSSTSTLVRVLHALDCDAWLDSLEVPRSTFNPLTLLEQRRREQRTAPKRVRHRVRPSV